MLDSASRDIFAVAVSALLTFTWVKAFDVAVTRRWLDQKTSRKIIHITTGPLFILTWPLFGHRAASRAAAASLPAMNLVRLYLAGSGLLDDPGAVKSMTRGGNRAELLRGPFYYSLAMLLAVVFGWRDSIVGFTSLALMCGGDGLADVVGRRLGGGNPLPYNKSKSFAGSLAMFGGGLAMSASFGWYFAALGYIEPSTLPPTWPSLLLISFVCTFIESLPINDKLDDNLSVPAAAWSLGLALLPPIGPPSGSLQSLYGMLVA